MKLIDNVTRPVGQPIRMYFEMLGKRKMHILVATLFLFGSFFLSQAVLFDAAVPFFLPVWALARARFRKYLIWVFVGGMFGSAFLGFGQAVIHLLMLALFNAVIKYPLMRKSVPLDSGRLYHCRSSVVAVCYVCWTTACQYPIIDWF